MATALNKLTGMGSDVRKLARLLQAKAPEGHMLAYINPREAALLKAHGGSGKPHADTGIPSFENEGDAIGPVSDDFQPQGMSPEQVAAANPDLYYQGIPAEGKNDFFTKTAGGEPAIGQAPQSANLQEIQATYPYASVANKGYFQGQDIQDQLAGATGADLSKPVIVPPSATAVPKGMSNETLAKLGITGLQGIIGATTARNAAAQGQQAKAETQALATPYQQKGQQLQAQAQRGELTPQAQQSLQAVQAQVAQGAEARGGVGAAQAANQVEAFRQQLLAQQYDYGLKLSGIGDQIALGAIKTGMQADQYANQLTNTFFNNIARTVYGQPAA